jgi:hypothetical protein
VPAYPGPAGEIAVIDGDGPVVRDRRCYGEDQADFCNPPPQTQHRIEVPEQHVPDNQEHGHRADVERHPAMLHRPRKRDLPCMDTDDSGSAADRLVWFSPA